MRHRHHIIPRYEGGSDDDGNLVTLTPTQHAMWHYAEWMRKSNYKDYCAYKMILGDVNNPAFKSAQMKAFQDKIQSGAREWRKGNITQVREHAQQNNRIQRQVLKEQGRTIAEKKWLITTPTGDDVVITNMAQYCRENDLCKSKMTLVAQGIRKQHKGYKCHKL